MEKTCKYCNQVFINVKGRWFSNHVRWCDRNPKKNTNNIKIACQKQADKKYGKYRNFNVVCSRCGKNFVITKRLGLFIQENKYFCSRNCSNSRVHSDETKSKIRNSINKFYLENGMVPFVKKVCLNCNKEFKSKKTQLYCSRKCGASTRRASTEYLQYKSDCKFTFNIWHYPNEFDLSLIHRYGLYKAKNNGNNIGGISRDHCISVHFGWKNGLNPKIISHPANCQLMRHSDNISKHKNCSISLEELAERIKRWNECYENFFK